MAREVREVAANPLAIRVLGRGVERTLLLLKDLDLDRIGIRSSLRGRSYPSENRLEILAAATWLAR